MIFKSYIIENNFDLLQSNIVLFYGENLGLKFDLKRIIKSKHKAEIVIFSQEEILKNEANFFDEFLNISLFNKEKIYFIDPSDDKILLIGGGCGVAPMLYTAKYFVDLGFRPTMLFGYRNNKEILREQEFKKYGKVYNFC